MLCDHLEGWDREGGRETQEGGDMGMYVYVQLIHFVIQKKHTIVKQLYSNKDVKKNRMMDLFLIPFHFSILGYALKYSTVCLKTHKCKYTLEICTQIFFNSPCILKWLGDASKCKMD